YNSIQLSTIDLTTFDYSNTYSFPIAIQNGFVNESGETEALVSVQVLGVAIEHFSVTALHTVKTPPGLIPTVITQSVDVKVRGKPDDLAKITPSNIMIVADLTDYSPGTSVIPAKVRFDSDIVGDFGAIDEYSLTVRLDRS
ncbi:MAG: hypothetical protein LBH28_10620, partial [Oscillospiraceae bacterium]|nr:hypothetical protein [Oscillospiraceae bacterium]